MSAWVRVWVMTSTADDGKATPEPQWWERAKCNGADPRDYELERWGRREDRPGRARELCEGCSVMVSCAVDAYPLHLAVSTVRGGVWIPEPVGRNGVVDNRAAREQLAALVSGGVS